MLPWKEAGTACLTQGVQNASKSLPRQMAISPNSQVLVQQFHGQEFILQVLSKGAELQL